MKVQLDILTPFQKEIPRRFGIHFPSILKLIPCRVRTFLPSFIQSYSSQGLITGLSLACCHGRSHSPIYSYPQRSSSEFPSITYPYNPPEEPIFVIPSQRILQNSISPQSLSFSIPGRAKASNYHSPAKPD